MSVKNTIVIGTGYTKQKLNDYFEKNNHNTDCTFNIIVDTAYLPGNQCEDIAKILVKYGKKRNLKFTFTTYDKNLMLYCDYLAESYKLENGQRSLFSKDGNEDQGCFGRAPIQRGFVYTTNDEKPEAVRLTYRDWPKVVKLLNGQINDNNTAIYINPRDPQNRDIKFKDLDKSEISGVYMIIHILSRNKVIRVLHGQWIVKDEDGEFSVYSNDQYQKLYRDKLNQFHQIIGDDI